jgi:hypothetical protein
VGISIHCASVDGHPVAFSHDVQQLDHTALSQVQNSSGTKSGSIAAGSVSDAAEKAYWAYLTYVSRERKPTLFIQIPKFPKPEEVIK